MRGKNRERETERERERDREIDREREREWKITCSRVHRGREGEKGEREGEKNEDRTKGGGQKRNRYEYGLTIHP